MAPVPPPVTTTDEFLAAIHTELVGLRADLARVAPASENTGILTEPAPKPAARKRTQPSAKPNR